MTDLKISALNTDKVGYVSTGTKHSLTVKTKFSYGILEMEDVNFHFDSAVLLPDYGPEAPKEGSEEQNRITGLGVLYTCFKYAEKFDYEKSILVAGHTDKKGSSDYNFKLSKLRSENVYCALTGDRKRWVEICDKKHQVEDYQQILKWISYNWGWDCDPGPKTNKDNEETKEATKKFQEKYNSEYNASIPENGKVGKETWGAFFDVYMEELQIIMGLDQEGLQNYQKKLNFVKKEEPSPCPCVGCGEAFPASEAKTEDENPIDRRVEILFFEEDEIPELKCHPTKDTHMPSKCDLYNSTLYKRNPVPAEPLPLPSGIAARVFLQLKYKGPSDKELNFPEEFDVIVDFPDGTSQNEKTKEEGKLSFTVPRSKKSFTLRFDSDNLKYMSYPSASSDAEKKSGFVFEAEVRGKISSGINVFMLPKKWSLKNSDWDVLNTDSYSKPDFTGIEEKKKNIGSEATRVDVILNPHWMHFKMLYFDRWVKKKLTIPPVVLDIYNDYSSGKTEPDGRSCWITDTEKSFGIPWILRDTPKPDNKVQIVFRSVKGTYICTTGKPDNYTVKLVTKKVLEGPAVPSDPGLTIGELLDYDFSKAVGKRLAYYDLPEIWRSTDYFCRLSGGSGQPAAKEGKFQDLASEKTTDDKPLMVSLDDMVLTDINLNPIDWKPDEQPKNRISIYSNLFSAAGPDMENLSSQGLFKPDGRAVSSDGTLKLFSGNRLMWVTQLPSVEKTRNYIVDYTDWTRIILTQGNCFDVFDKRIPDKPGQVVGARAAVRVADVFSSTSTFVPPGTNSPNVPAPIKPAGLFCEYQAFFKQEHEFYNEIGRNDIIHVRCADIDEDQETEIAACIVYLRLNFNFNPTFAPAFDSDAVPSALNENDAKTWTQVGVRNLMQRWTGPDGDGNAGPSYILSADNKIKYKSKIVWIVQALPKDMCHFEIGIFKKNDNTLVRAYMQTRRGVGVLDETNNHPDTDNWLTIAHECGHGNSLVDDYIEQTTPTTFPVNTWLPGFDSNSAGSPYVRDYFSMMNTNQRARLRQYWHLAEWLRQLSNNTIDYKLKMGDHNYIIPHMAEAPIKNYIGWPCARNIDQELGDHGKIDIFLHPFGTDEFSATVLPLLANKKGEFDGMINVIVKMRFVFDTNNTNLIHDFLNNIQLRIFSTFNYKFGVKGNSVKKYSRCLLHFSPRFRADHYSATNPRDTSQHIRINVRESGTPHWDSGIFSSRTTLIFARNVPDQFTGFFANMVGIASTATATASSYLPIAQKVIPDAEVFAL